MTPDGLATFKAMAEVAFDALPAGRMDPLKDNFWTGFFEELVLTNVATICQDPRGKATPDLSSEMFINENGAMIGDGKKSVVMNMTVKRESSFRAKVSMSFNTIDHDGNESTLQCVKTVRFTSKTSK